MLIIVNDMLVMIIAQWRLFFRSDILFIAVATSLVLLVLWITTGRFMNCECVPVEFKHIDKRRRTHNNEYLQSLRMNMDYITQIINDSCIELLYTYVAPVYVHV